MVVKFINTLFLITILSSCSEVNVEIYKPESVSISTGPLISKIGAESKPDGSGELITNTNIWTRTANVDIYAIQRDLDGNFVENSIVQWTLEGSAGSLIVQSGGKSASFVPASSGEAKITFSIEGKSKTVTLNVNYNEAPIFNFITPNGGDNTIVESNSYSLQWTDSDTDDDAKINLYYSTNSSGQCDSGNSISSNISENNNNDNFLWDTTGLPAGVYYLCATIEDSLSKEEVWNSQAFNIISNNAPTLSFNTPASGVTSSIHNTAGITLDWNDTDIEDDASINFYLVTSTGVACSTGSLIHSTTEDSAVDTFVYDTSLLATGTYYICAELDDSFNSAVKVVSSAISVFHNCSWVGVDTNFTNTANWNNCNSLSPQTRDLLILNATANDPVISSNTTIQGIAAGGVNIPITINAGARLSLTSGDSKKFLGSVTFKGSSATCTTCEIVLGGDDTFVLNNSTLRLESGISLYSATSTIDLGNGTTAGHLEIVGGVPDSEKVRVLNGAPWGFRGIVLNGTNAIKSSINANNVIMSHYHGYASGSTKGFHFKDNYEILGLDNIKFTKSFLVSQSEMITFENCANGIFTDRDFSNLEFFNHFTAASHNIEMNNTTCTSLPGATPITMTNASGWGYGSVFEYDPNNLVTWFNEAALLCEWNGAVDSDWKNPANWSNCNNGRGNFPDQFDSAYFPIGTPNSVEISEKMVIQKIATPGGPGGGLVTINANSRLWLAGKEVLSDVVVTGSPDNCTNCGFGSESTSILNNAHLFLQRGLDLYSNSGTPVFKAGNGVSNGHLTINPNSTDQSFWPTIQPTSYYNGGFTVEGVDVANRSSIELNGIRSPNHYNRALVAFKDFYEVIGLDNMIMKQAFTWSMNGDLLTFDNCANSIFTDLNWENLDFVSSPQNPLVSNYNISFANCGAMAAGMINISPISGGTNAAYGASYANDPTGILNWLP